MVETTSAEGDAEASRSPESEERRRTGQYMALGVVVATFLIGLYHACLQKNAALAGLLVPSLIMILYLAWVLYSARHKKYWSQRDESSTVEAGGLTPRAARRLAEHCYSGPQQMPAPPELNNVSRPACCALADVFPAQQVHPGCRQSFQPRR